MFTERERLKLAEVKRAQRSSYAKASRFFAGYLVNHLIEFAAAVDIRPVIVRQERIGLHMADAIHA